MAQYRIVCVETAYEHRHINYVGTGSDADHASSRWSVAEVRTALRQGHTFYTVSPSTGRVANVEAYDAWTSAGWVYTIRSTADAVYDNNLDNLRACSWKA